MYVQRIFNIARGNISRFYDTMNTEGSNEKSAGQIHLVYGNNELEVSQTARKLVDQLCPPDKQSLGLETIIGYGKNSEQAVGAIKNCIESLRTVGFFGGGKTVWLRDAEFLDISPVAQAAVVKEMMSALTNIVKHGLPANCNLVTSSPKVYKNSAFYKACKANGSIHEHKLAEKLNQITKNARNTAIRYFADAGLNARQEVIDTFLNRCGTDPRQMLQEVEKLSLYLTDRQQVTSADITTIVTPAAEAAFWDIGNAIANRNAKEAIRLVRQEAEKGGGFIGMIIGIERQFHQLMILRECMRGKIFTLNQSRNGVTWSKNPEHEALLKTLFPDARKNPRKMHPFRLAKMAEQAMKYTRSELRNGLHAILETHEAMVSCSIPRDTQLELLILKITG